MLIIYSHEQNHSVSFVPKFLIRIKIKHLIREFNFIDFSSSLIKIILISLIIIQSGLLFLRKPLKINKKLSKWVVMMSWLWLFAILKIYKAALELALARSTAAFSSLLMSICILAFAFYNDRTNMFQRWVRTPLLKSTSLRRCSLLLS
jgi:hypothetical protein